MPLSSVSSTVPARLSSAMAGAGGVGVDVVSGGLSTGGPPGGVPVAVAVLLTEPAMMSACVTVYWTGPQVTLSPMASAPPGQVTGPTFGSDTVTGSSGWLPALVTTNVYSIVSPASTPLSSLSTTCPARL